MLILFSGLPGIGKIAVAAELARVLRAPASRRYVGHPDRA